MHEDIHKRLGPVSLYTLACVCTTRSSDPRAAGIVCITNAHLFLVLAPFDLDLI